MVPRGGGMAIRTWVRDHTGLRSAGLRCALGFALLASAAGALAQAPGYPSKPLRMIIPFAPGTPDAQMRIVAERLNRGWASRWYSTIAPGAAGSVGMEAAARSAPDARWSPGPWAPGGQPAPAVARVQTSPPGLRAAGGDRARRARGASVPAGGIRCRTSSHSPGDDRTPQLRVHGRRWVRAPGSRSCLR
jgi:hypothetical protein